nr:MAG TPA: hypothetical protein [Caudoviricetes sp.]
MWSGVYPRPRSCGYMFISDWQYKGNNKIQDNNNDTHNLSTSTPAIHGAKKK